MLKRILLWMAVLTLSVFSVDAAWTPPANPDANFVNVLRSEIKADFAAKRYEEALAKHVWYHENAMKYDAGQAGVRLSFVLNDWLQLSKAYPPALEKLKTIRDDTGKQLEQGKGDSMQFLDFSSINRVLEERQRTVDLFLGLDAKFPELATKAYHIAKYDLILAKKFDVCGKYLKGEANYEALLHVYRVTQDIESKRSTPNRSQFARPNFRNETSTLVALLVKNSRAEEAQKIAAAAARELPDADFKAELDKALKGEIPPPWPK